MSRVGKKAMSELRERLSRGGRSDDGILLRRDLVEALVADLDELTDRAPQISVKYWRVARALTFYYLGDVEMADHILEAAFGVSYEPEDIEIRAGWDVGVAAEPVEFPDYVSADAEDKPREES